MSVNSVSVSQPSLLFANDGIVSWISGDTANFTVYDPMRGAWIGGSGTAYMGYQNWVKMANIDGVVAWTSEGMVRFATYDPIAGVWCQGSGSSPTPDVIGCAGGVVLWNDHYLDVPDQRWLGGYGYAIYDPVLGWVKGQTDWIGTSASYSISDDATVTIVTGGRTFIRGYYHNYGWSDGSTVPFVYYAASATRCAAPADVWFTDMSIALDGLDGAIYKEFRSCSHIHG